MIDWAAIGVAFSIGLLGSAHCIGMCGGIMGALTMATSVESYYRRLFLIITYNIGRIASYLFIAWIFYQLIHNVQDYFALQFMRYVSGLLLIAMGLYLANWWRGLVYLEKAGGYLWRFIQPFSRSLLPVKTCPQAFLLGIIWGWLPCGLIYSALTYAIAADTASNAILVMLAFALGTLPSIVASGLLAERLLVVVKKAAVRQAFAVLIILFGVWTLFYAVKHAGHHDHHQDHSTPHSSPEASHHALHSLDKHKQHQEQTNTEHDHSAHSHH